MLTKIGLFFAFISWILASAWGLEKLLTYSSTSGQQGPYSLSWPKASPITPDPHRPTLLLFLHPECPCSRASVAELDVLMAQIQGKARVYAVFSSRGQNLSLWKQAKAIPGVIAYEDRGGLEARRFGAQTSGHLALYSEGRLRFNGGITPARGHQGDSSGRRAVVSFFHHRSTASRLAQAPVFGCGLSNRGIP